MRIWHYTARGGDIRRIEYHWFMYTRAQAIVIKGFVVRVIREQDGTALTIQADR
jgi:acylphosphatase